MTGKSDLDQAYDLETPDDSRRLYKGWARTYDADFAARRGYAYPAAVAEAFGRGAGADHGPVLDVGAGTGLVGAALAEQGDWAIDGLDISPEMLTEAKAKGCYRAVIEADLTKPLDLGDDAYGGVVSAGTFTHGHVGPEALDELLRVARRGARFAIGVNLRVWGAQGFEAKIRDFLSAGWITAPELLRTKVYDAADVGDGHANDVAVIAVFDKA